ncbi:energy-converting hydrogenase Eha subunit A [Pedobacter cryoconitis]|uniref:Energy-converting hydrogenase Eha subunit A n=1 Tax=Pedobacter cryoconitis TaxID=188932 RepID=A0A7W8ZN07_9SPHI|nr:hypothetical protein [Pedobacter cryoconitis]MBB5636905.1 energy-converting hydrogenase Eha subunit A [Pedobacter cryoconitis]MBB6271305.1 energy-converting hydrogenase Eha subunit A [Pedobacter cryoconitis]
MNNQTVLFITRLGAVILGTLTTFIISPPLLSPADAQVVSWRNVFVFFTGLLSIFIFDNVCRIINIRKIMLGLLGLFMVVIAFYQYLITEFSILCYNDFRIVISHGPLKSDEISNSTVWKDHPDYYNLLLESHFCNSRNLWGFSELWMPYYGMLILYLIAAIILTILLISIGEIIKINSHE